MRTSPPVAREIAMAASVEGVVFLTSSFEMYCCDSFERSARAPCVPQILMARSIASAASIGSQMHYLGSHVNTPRIVDTRHNRSRKSKE